LQLRRAGESRVELIYAIDADIPAYLIGDPLRLGQVLTNLTQNAIKFTQQGQVTIAVALISDEANQVCLEFSVLDTGIGIEAEKLSSLFEPFSQADGSTTRRYGGSGLGLAISKQLVAIMGGEIGVESELGVGSRFYFSARFGAAKVKLDQRPTELNQLRVLLADDNAAARVAIEKMLKQFSFRVTSVNSGKALISELDRALLEEPTDLYGLVIVDAVMPKMDGVEVGRLIRKSSSFAELPLVLMIHMDSPEGLIGRAELVGFSSFLVKPSTPSSLFDAVVSSLGSGREQARPSRLVSTEFKPPDLSGLVVLVVEDNRINQQIARELLENAGVQVEITARGADVIDLLAQTDFDLVLMDMQMPDMDGYQATQLIRKQGQYAELPIVAMTAHALLGDREKCLAAGMNDYLAKPVDPEEFYRLIGRWGAGLASVDADPSRSVQITAASELPSDLIALDIYGIDAAVGLQRVGGNELFYRQLLQGFLTDHGEDEQHLLQAHKKGDLTLLNRVIHTMQGLAGNLGALELEVLAERACDDSANKAIEQLDFDQLTVELRLVLAGIGRLNHFGSGQSDTYQHELNFSTADAIEELAGLLQQGDSGAVKKLDGCIQVLGGRATPDQLLRLQLQVNGYEFDQALLTLEQIID
ncbi:MAG: response regulator, partial [Immundisolibacteraceae bacterium]|nr:response regulator [Immundisolibacteraceae bacterium]